MGGRISSCVGTGISRKGSRGASPIPTTITFVPAANRSRSAERVKKPEDSPSEEIYGGVGEDKISDSYSGGTEGSFEADINQRLSRGKAELLQLQQEHYLLNETSAYSSLTLPLGILPSEYISQEESITPLLLPSNLHTFSPADRSLKMMIDQIFQACAHGNLLLLHAHFDSPLAVDPVDSQGSKEDTVRPLDTVYTIRTVLNLRHTCRNPLHKRQLRSPSRHTHEGGSNKVWCSSPSLWENESLYSQHMILSSESLDLTLLQYCVLLNQCECIDYLLQFTQDYDCNAINPQYGYNALHLAILGQQLQALEHLCRESRINTHERTLTHGQTAFHLAIELKNKSALDCLLRLKGPFYDIKQKDFSGNSLLHTAALYPHVQIMEMIVYFIEGKYFRYEVPVSPNNFPRQMSDILTLVFILCKSSSHREETIL